MNASATASEHITNCPVPLVGEAVSEIFDRRDSTATGGAVDDPADPVGVGCRVQQHGNAQAAGRCQLLQRPDRRGELLRAVERDQAHASVIELLAEPLVEERLVVLALLDAAWKRCIML
jgi:hypothetical protein